MCGGDCLCKELDACRCELIASVEERLAKLISELLCGLYKGDRGDYGLIMDGLAMLGLIEGMEMPVDELRKQVQYYLNKA